MAESRSSRRSLASIEETAEYLGITRGALAQMRYMGTGPAFHKIGRKVVYDLAEVNAWLDSNRHEKTGETRIAAAR